MDLLSELRTLILRHADGGLKRSILDGVNIAAYTTPTQPVGGFAGPSLTVVGQGVKRTILHGKAYDYRTGQYLVVSIDLPVTGHILQASPDEPFVVFSMELRPAAIAALLLETTAKARPPAFSGMIVSDAGAELLDPIVRLLRLLERPEDVRVLGPAYEREILWRLVTGEQAPIVRQIGLADGSLSQISRAIRWIREHYDDPLRVDELANRAGMSVSSFHRHFRSATSMTPLQFQKQIRLQEARALLMTRPRDIGEIGHIVGYESASQFSREYRRLFGAPPGRDAARMQVAAAPA